MKDQTQLCRRHHQTHALDADAEITGKSQIRGTAIDAAVERADRDDVEPFDTVGKTF